jgi:hypothetical protein
VGRGRHPSLLHQPLGEQLRSLDLCRRAPRSEGGDAGVLERVDEPRDEGRLRADDDEIDADLLRGADEAVDVITPDADDLGVLGDPGVPRRAEELGFAGRA